jgi:hypothetical protein
MSDIIDRLALQVFMTGKIESGMDSLYEDCLAEILRLRAENEKLRAAFRVNMLRAFPSMSHEEIDAEIAAAIRESVE